MTTGHTHSHKGYDFGEETSKINAAWLPCPPRLRVPKPEIEVERLVN